ncbi:hypothetical protein NC651_023251 [Populus alba x Populus x berolinensis]|nr:hypothetical protein NC651_023251 [Populus alba x Populus x berolinensis]
MFLRYQYGVIDFGELIERQQPPKRLQFALVQPPPPNKSNNSREMVAFLLYDHINLVKAQPITVINNEKESWLQRYRLTESFRSSLQSLAGMLDKQYCVTF